MENIKNILTFILIGVDVLLVLTILMQQREGGLSSVFGGSDNVYRSRRGLARGIHYMTVALAVIFVGLSIAVLFL